MDHDRTGLSEDEQRAFAELASSFGAVRVPRSVSAVGLLRRHRAVLSAVVAAVCLAVCAPLLVLGPWVSFAVFVVAVVVVELGWRSWVEALRSSALGRFSATHVGRSSGARAR